MTGRPNQMLRSSKFSRDAESAPRTAFLNAQALRKAEARLEGYVASRRKEAAKYDNDLSLSSDWMD